MGFHDLSLFDRELLPNLTVRDVFANEIYSASRPLHLDENDEGYVLTLELPGFKQSHLDVSLEEDVLTVLAKKDETHRYERSVTLPSDIDPDKIEAKLEDGILTVRIGKVEQAKPRKISVN